MSAALEPEGDPAVSPKVIEFDERNLAYVAELRLKKLSKTDLRELYRRVAAKANTPFDESALALLSEAELVEGLLKLKKKLSTARAAPAEPEPDEPAPPAEAAAPAAAPAVACLNPDAIEAPERPETPAPVVERVVESEDSKTELSAIVESHTLRICSFNANKLRLHEMKDRGDDGSEEAETLRQHWINLANILAEYDVVVMQEIPKGEAVKPARVQRFSLLLHMFSPDGKPGWCEPIFSEPSGVAGGDPHRGEVHVAWVREGICVERQSTLTELVLEPNTPMQLDYAPLQLLLRDDRFKNEEQRRIALTSVHMAPESRAATRDAQLKALLSRYASKTTSAYRLGENFPNDGGPSQGRPIHVIAGDFNVYPGATVDTRHGKKLDEPEEAYGLTKNGFVAKIPEYAATSVGKKNYDNFVVDAHADSRFQIHATILKLAMPQNSATGLRGLSDHNPVVLEIIDTETVKKPTPRRSPRKAQE